MITARAKDINASDGPDVRDAYKLLLEMVGRKELLPIVADAVDDDSSDLNDKSNTADGDENQENDDHAQRWINNQHCQQWRNCTFQSSSRSNERRHDQRHNAEKQAFKANGSYWHAPQTAQRLG